jgi:hypothetical protein
MERRVFVKRGVVRGVAAALAAVLMLNLAGPALAVRCADCPGDEGGGGGGGGTPALPVPDAAFQFQAPIIGCLPDDQLSYLTGKLSDNIKAALRKAGEEDPEPDVRALCTDGRQNVAVWFKPVGAYGLSDTDHLRNEQLALVNILTGSEKAGVRITAKGIDRQVAEQVAKRQVMDDDGTPTPDGPVHLTDYTVSLKPAASPGPSAKRSVKTTIDGYYEVEHLAVEEPQGAHRLVEGGPGDVAITGQVQLVLADMLRGELIGRDHEVAHEVADPAQVAVASTGAVPTDTELFVHPVAESPQDVLLLASRGVTPTSRTSGVYGCRSEAEMQRHADEDGYAAGIATRL